MKSIFIAICLFQIVVAYDFYISDDGTPEAKCFREATKKLGPTFFCPGAIGLTDPVKLRIVAVDCSKKIFLDAKCGDGAKWIELCLRSATLKPGVTLPPQQTETYNAVLLECDR